MTQPIDTTLVPAPIRAQGTKAVQLYAGALQFEQLLVQQLAQGLTDATQTQDSTDDSSDDGSSTSPGGDGLGVYQGLLPDALAQSVTGSGGMGLAMDLYTAMGGKETAR